MIKILADFNNRDEQGRVRLSTAGALKDIAKHKAELREGLEVIPYEERDFEVRAKLVFDLGMWKGVPDMATLRYYDDPA
jgi:hypothetical protein